MTPHLLDVDQAAEWLNIPASTLRRMVSARQVPFTRLGKHVRFAPTQLEEIVSAGDTRPVVAPTRLQLVATKATALRRRAA